MLMWSALTPFSAISPTPGDSPLLREALVLGHMQQGDVGPGGQSLVVACLDELSASALPACHTSGAAAGQRARVMRTPSVPLHVSLFLEPPLTFAFSCEFPGRF